MLIFLTISLFAQAPQKMSYQAVIRNTRGGLVTKQNVGMQISILQGPEKGKAVYVETQTPTTDANGLVPIEIGGGTVVTGTFAGIDWSTGPYYLKTETDTLGGTNYTITGTSQILSVPYSLYAESTGNGSIWLSKGSNIYFAGANVGIGSDSTDELLHLKNGNLLIEGDGKEEYALMAKRKLECMGKSGKSINPFFQLGRIICGGDGDPEFRFLYKDDNQEEIPVFEFDRKGIVASVKPAPPISTSGNKDMSRGSHFEGFYDGAEQPYFRLNSFPRMRLEMGEGGNKKKLVDVAIERFSKRTLGFYTDTLGSPCKVVIDSLGKMGIGTTTPTYELTVNGTAWCSSGAWTGSDARWKRNVKDLNYKLSDILELNPVNFELRTDEFPEMGFETGTQIGLIAQDVEKLFPELVRTDNFGYKAVSYEKLAVILLEGIKEQQKQIDELKELVKNLIQK